MNKEEMLIEEWERNVRLAQENLAQTYVDYRDAVGEPHEDDEHGWEMVEEAKLCKNIRLFIRLLERTDTENGLYRLARTELAAPTQLVIDNHYKELAEVVRHYLTLSSLDGVPERRQLRQKLGEMVGITPKEQEKKNE